jgi:hypothetical protein
LKTTGDLGFVFVAGMHTKEYGYTLIEIEDVILRTLHAKVYVSYYLDTYLG